MKKINNLGPTAAQIAALGGHESAPLVQDVITKKVIDGDANQSSVSGDTPVTVAMVQVNTPPAGGADGYCTISDGDGSV